LASASFQRKTKSLLSELGGLSEASGSIPKVSTCSEPSQKGFFNMFTIMITARNAAKTIERAVLSCRDEGAKLLLVDDSCTDDTVERAVGIAGSTLQVIRPPAPGGLPVARQAGLDAVQTEYAAWLDADDEWLPGRIDRLLKALKQGADVVADAIELHDGQTGRFLRRMEVPPFLRHEPVPVRLFERNYLPGDTQVGFRVTVFRKAGGYDPVVFGPESFDVLLRSIARGTRFAYLPDSGYRMFAYPGSVSRDLPGLRRATATVLRKHDYQDVLEQCVAAGYSLRLAHWLLVSMALYRDDPASALCFLDHASPQDSDPKEILEPKGPQPLPEGWRRAFYRGTILLLTGENAEEAEKELRRAENIQPSAEVANNLGVAMARMGKLTMAKKLFKTALHLFPGYWDANQNLESTMPDQITTHPFRSRGWRHEYT